MLQQGYNLVTERVEETDGEMPALAFFRELAGGNVAADRLTVTGLDDLVYRADDYDEAIRGLRGVLRDVGAFGGPKAVQFVVDGELVDDDILTVRTERGGDPVYLPLGNLFVDEPEFQSGTHAVARK
jgi:hypothetical protein